MKLAEHIANLARYNADLKEVDNYEAVRRFRAFSKRCYIATEWQKTLIALEASGKLEALPAQLVRESRKELAKLQAAIKRDIDDAAKRNEG